jgi:acyl carrier protein
MATKATTPESVRDYINESFSTRERTLALKEDDQLLEALDSLQVLRLVMELESKFSIRFDNSEMTPDNLGSITKIAAFVNSKS